MLSMHNDVNCSCGLCWTLIWDVAVFFFFFTFHVQALGDGIHDRGNLHSCHHFCSSLPLPSFPLLPSKCPLLFHPSLYSPLCCFGSLSPCPFLSFCFFLLPAPLALPPGRGGTVMFMKPFNVLCNYPGNTSHHYSRQ